MVQSCSCHLIFTLLHFTSFPNHFDWQNNRKHQGIWITAIKGRSIKMRVFKNQLKSSKLNRCSLIVRGYFIFRINPKAVKNNADNEQNGFDSTKINCQSQILFRWSLSMTPRKFFSKSILFLKTIRCNILKQGTKYLISCLHLFFLSFRSHPDMFSLGNSS